MKKSGHIWLHLSAAAGAQSFKYPHEHTVKQFMEKVKGEGLNGSNRTNYNRRGIDFIARLRKMENICSKDWKMKMRITR